VGSKRSRKSNFIGRGESGGTVVDRWRTRERIQALGRDRRVRLGRVSQRSETAVAVAAVAGGEKE